VKKPMPQISRRKALQSLSTLALPLLAACRRRTSTGALREVIVAYVPRITMSPLHVAEEEGFFREAGLRIVFQMERKNEHIVSLLADGKADVGFAQVLPALINSIASGAHVRIVAGRDVAVSTSCSSFGSLYGNRKAFPHGLSDLHALKGKRVAVSGRAHFLAFCLDAALSSAGLSLADVHLLEMEQTLAIPALMAGQIDATEASFMEARQESLTADLVRGPSLADVLPGMQYNFTEFGPRFVDGDPRIGTAFLSAYFRGARAFAAGRVPQKFIRSLGLEIGVDPDLVLKGCRSGAVLDGRIDVASIQRVLDWSVKSGFCPNAPTAAAMIDTRFADAMRAADPLKGAS
jgi:ABC-type nitrate/sulfonate/bicarbonate transport system substrate-binding protein